MDPSIPSKSRSLQKPSSNTFRAFSFVQVVLQIQCVVTLVRLHVYLTYPMVLDIQIHPWRPWRSTFPQKFLFSHSASPIDGVNSSHRRLIYYIPSRSTIWIEQSAHWGVRGDICENMKQIYFGIFTNVYTCIMCCTGPLAKRIGCNILPGSSRDQKLFTASVTNQRCTV